ncbi:MAG: GCN5-related N-acetyltransferase [Solirubrobacterales bacterium]|nr:GCN5-related N-acetyltransferase [Solirubrobacterales bacterium]
MIEVRAARDDEELSAALAVRHAAFVVEQHVPVADELDGRDDRALHLVAIEEGTVVATCRLLPDGATVKLSRMAVAASARRRGMASALLHEAEERARTQGAQRIALSAQTDALGLYERAGYTAYGRRFMDAGIEHLMMEKRLA